LQSKLGLYTDRPPPAAPPRAQEARPTRAADNAAAAPPQEWGKRLVEIVNVGPSFRVQFPVEMATRWHFGHETGKAVVNGTMRLLGALRS
jgi:hypothetical protein